VNVHRHLQTATRGGRAWSARGALLSRPAVTATTAALTVLLGSLVLGLASPARAEAATPSQAGPAATAVPGTAGSGPPKVLSYWLVASDGGIFSFGGAGFYGSTGGMTLNRPVVGMAGTPDSKGYWLVASDGGIFSFGDARFYGSMGGIPLNRPVVGMAATPTGGGYWEVASDGGIFSFGNARFYGSMGGTPLNRPVVGMAATPTGGGYTMVAADGGIFSFGNARFFGSLGGVPQSLPVVGMAMPSTGDGYWFTDSGGAVSAFGGAGYWGSAPQVLNRPVVGIAAATGTGAFADQAFQSGSYGYDVSVYQCGQYPPGPHAIGVVEVNGTKTTQTQPNPCLAQEAAWAGAGLNLYDYLSYGTTATGPPGCGGSTACNFGFDQARRTFAMATTAGVDPLVTWWLDVEPGTWSPTASQNAQVVQGAMLGLRAEGVNTVGIYASPTQWNLIVGGYQPDVPYWMAWWTTTLPTGGGGPYNCAHVSTWTSRYQLPTGPVVLTQYSDNVGGFDGDYAC